MVVTVLSSILGSRLRVVTPCLLLMGVNRLHGIGQEVYPEGTHFMVLPSSWLVDAQFLPTNQIPWFETPIVYDIRAKPRSIASLTGTKGRDHHQLRSERTFDCILPDLQMVNITCRVLSRPSQSALPTIYRELGTDYDERVLPSIVNEVLKSVVAQFNASQLITQREMVWCRTCLPPRFDTKSG